MFELLCSVLRSTRATAAVEAAIFAPFFLTVTVGITDVGTRMFAQMTVNAAAQTGAIYAVANSGTGLVCASSAITTPCLNGIKTAMNDASGNSSFCAGTGCSASILTPCADGSPRCITVSASYQCNTANKCLLLPDAAYSWAQPLTLSSTAIIRVE